MGERYACVYGREMNIPSLMLVVLTCLLGKFVHTSGRARRLGVVSHQGPRSKKCQIQVILIDREKTLEPSREFTLQSKSEV